MTDRGVARAGIGVGLVVAGLLVPSVVRGQEGLLPLRTDTVAYAALEIRLPSLVWFEFTTPRGVTKPSMTVARVLPDGSRDSSSVPAVVPATGLFLPAGHYVTSLSERSSARPDTVWYRIKASAIQPAPPPGADPSASLPLQLDTPAGWRGTELTYAIQLPAAGTVTVLGNSDGLEVVWRDSAGAELGNHPAIQVVGPTALSASVRWSAAGNQEAAIAFRFFELADDLEPNDIPDLATPVDLDQWYAVSLGQPGDLDHVEVTVSQRGVLVIQASGGSEPVTGATLLLKDGSQVPLPAQVAPGTHLIRLDRGSAAWSPDPSLVRLTLRSLSGSAVSDTTAGLIWGTPHPLLLGPPDGTDFVAILLKEPGIVEWTTSSGEPGDRPLLVLLKGDSAVSRAAPIGTVRLAAGSYVAKVSRKNIPGRETGVLWMFWSPETDRQEPNDEPGMATPLQLPSVVPIRIHPSGDVDWFRFEVKDAGVLRVTRAKGSLFFRGGLVFQVRRMSDSAVVPERVRNKVDLDVHFLLAPGVHELRVAASISSPEPALVSLAFEPARGGVETAGDLAMGLIGLGLKQESRDWIRASAEGSGTLFHATEDSAGFETALDSTLQELVTAVKPATSPWTVIGALALVALVLFIGYKLRARSRA